MRRVFCVSASRRIGPKKLVSCEIGLKSGVSDASLASFEVNGKERQMERGKWSELPAGRVSAAMNRLLIALGDDAARVIPLINLEESFARRITRYAVNQIGPDGHLIPEVRSWREEDGIIYFSVTSDGTTGKDWITRLESRGFNLEYRARRVLLSPSFKPTSDMTTEVAVLKGMLFEDNKNRSTKNIFAEGASLKLYQPNVELACLIREKFTDEEIEAMNLIWIVTMHEGLDLLYADRCGTGYWLRAYGDGPDYLWGRGSGFAFVVSQTYA